MSPSTQDDLTVKSRDTRTRTHRLRWYIIGAVVPMILFTSSSLIRSYKEGSDADDISAALGGTLIGIPVAVGLILLVLVLGRKRSQRNIAVMESLLRGSVKIERLLHALETDVMLRRIGGSPAKNPGFEYVSAAFAESGLVIVDKAQTPLAWIPKERILGVESAMCPMLNGPERRCLVLIIEHDNASVRIPFLVIADKWIAVRGLREDELSELASAMIECFTRGGNGAGGR